MSIQGIRRIREAKYGSPDRTLRLQPSKWRDETNVFTPVDTLLPTTQSLKKTDKDWRADKNGHHSVGHRKTGSLCINRKR
jgi:hypothetical protein